ncbi:MAG TPA: carboxypeptidase-like regulatory domain-containing protein [Bryobacteraceae bacterium]|jgi:hypothetical protein|nr:carboxypeptidase-like regulatory domain-containing protein [Bryobacteraceae bacterium]
MYPKTKSSDPVVGCGKKSEQQKQTGDILVEVRIYCTADPKRKPVTGINVELKKDDANAGKGSTDSKGRVTFSGLDPGSYSVGLKIGPSLARLYDVDPPPPAQTKSVVGNKTTAYAFELRYYRIAFSVTYPDGKLAQKVDYELRLKKITGAQQTLDKDWSSYKTGSTTAEDYSEDYVPKGRYQLRLKAVSDVQLSKPQVTIGEAVDLSAEATGFDDGTAGSFEIFDARNLAKSMYSISANTAANALKASWTPDQSQLGSLKSGWIVAQAKVSSAQAFSPELKVVTKTEYDLVDKAGNNLDGRLLFHFSGGDQVDADAAGGKAQVLVPWNQTLTRIQVPDQRNSRVELQTDSGVQKFVQT